MHPSTDMSRTESLVTTMCERITTITRTLGSWMQENPRTLADTEQHVLRLVKDLGATLLTGLADLASPLQPPATVPCSCGHSARYLRHRPATVTTLLGPITFHRPYYLCRVCRHGQHPLDHQLQMCAGSRSAALDELLALLGATQDSFVEAASVLEHLTLVHISPNSVRDATETLGATLVEHQQHAVTRALDGHDVPQATTPAPSRLYITMDGVLAHLHERGWSELKVGCCYQTHCRPERKRREHLEIRAHSISYVTALTEAQTFGWHLWQEATRRGVTSADEVVVVADGAHWIWNIADLHFPHATQIVDWYHASEYVWDAARAVWGETHPQREAWAHQQLERLWAGKVDEVVGELEAQQDAGKGVRAALSYYTTHRERMDYATYRARGLQIGSGSVESACKQVVSARLKQAGMIWDGSGAQSVATVRSWLKSGRWQEAMALRGVRRRTYQRRGGATQDEVVVRLEAECMDETGAEKPCTHAAKTSGLSPDVLAQVRAELAQKAATHPWRKPWSVKRQREQHQEQTHQARTAFAA